MTRARVTVLLGAMSATMLTGCVGGGTRAGSIDERVEFVDDASVRVAPGDYADAFERARDALRRAGFEIDRVDAGAGEITTAPMPGLAAWKSPLLRRAGVAEALSPEGWHATTVEARASFTPTEEADRGADLRDATAPLTLRFEVVERREHRPGRRIDTTSVVYASTFSDRGYGVQGMEPGFTVATRRNLDAELLLAREVGSTADIPSP